MSEFQIVGLAGAAGAGKDTAADILCQHGFMRYAFAKPLKAALNAMFGWAGFEWNLREWKETPLRDIGKSPRQMAQTLGTEWGRMLVNQDLWLLLAKREIELVRRMGVCGIVLTDCRFENEAQFVRNMGGKVIRIERPGIGAVSEHVSEKQLPDGLVDALIVNDSTIESFQRHVCAVVFSSY